VLAGTAVEAHESGAVHTNWTEGTVKRIAWKSWKEDILAPKTNVLLEIFGKYRTDHERKLKQVESFAKALSVSSEKLTVASYDTSENYLPPGAFSRERFASHSEWYWIPAGGGSPTKLAKPKKDASIEKVIRFLKSQAHSSGVEFTMDEMELVEPPESPAQPEEVEAPKSEL